MLRERHQECIGSSPWASQVSDWSRSVALGCAPAPPAPPKPTEFTVNTTADTSDFKAGDGLCADATLKCSLRAAVTEANAQNRPTTIHLGRATYSLNLEGGSSDSPTKGDLDVVGEVIIDGRGATVDASGRGDRIFDVAQEGSLDARNLRLVGASAVPTESGGAVRSKGNLLLHRVTATGNRVTGAGASGGALLNEGGTVMVTNSNLSNNSAVRAGGAIEASGGRTQVDDTTMSGNVAGPVPGNGGALHLTGVGNVTVNRSVVTDNTAGSEGGGLWNSGGGTMTVAGTTLTGNIANGVDPDNGGGALFNDGGSLTVNTSTVSDNSAVQGSGSGGGVFNNAGTLTVRNSTFGQNSAARAGGAVETAGGNVADAGSGSGGGILSEHGATTVTNSTVSDNVSARAGGGIEVAGGSADLADVELNRNSTGNAPGNGGGMHLGGASVVTVDASQVLANHASNEGGGLWNSPGGTLTVSNTSVTSNTVGNAPNGPNVFQKGPLVGGVFTVNGAPIAEGPNALAFG